MKRLLTIVLLSILVVSCKKEFASKDRNAFMEVLQAYLKDSMQKADYTELDFPRAILSRINRDTSYLRIPIKGKLLQNEFVLLQTNDYGTIVRGRKISLIGSKQPDRPTEYNGSIVIHLLGGQELVQSEIIRGYITVNHPKIFKSQHALTGIRSTVALLEPAPVYEELPEVVVVGYRSGGGDMSFVNWMSFVGMFGESSGGASSGYYGSSDGYGGSSSYGGGSGSTGDGVRSGGSNQSTYEDPPMLVDFEKQFYNAAIEIEEYIKCFSTIPDAGAICTIEILADIPVDNDPNKLFNWETESPGHTFLQIKKSNSSQSIIQNIGFYPKTNWKAMLTPAPVEGKFVDNGRHEFNAAFQMNITPAQLQSALTRILYLAKFIKYDIDEYNCTDFALEVFNYACSPSRQLAIPKYDIPGGMAPFGTSTPQGLYNKLKSMKASGSAEAANISMPGHKGWVASSNGPCN